MPKVLVLPDHIASQIAAGEVVERPASVVKELLENSIDAGASKIEIAVSNGCRDIRIADNGCGMPSEDALLAFHRHATSKLTSAEDLFALNTMGFRGEALPSIASVSRVTCLTRLSDASSGTKVEAADGSISAVETGCAPGTVMDVTDLFYNVPARLKFIKRPATEFAHIVEVVQSLALAYPKIIFQLLNQGEVVVKTSGSGKLAQAMVETGWVEADQELLPVTDADVAHGLATYGYVARPTSFRGDRKGILAIVNNRPVRCPLTYKALEYAFQDLLPRGKHPIAVLTVTIDPAKVDVNIHPTKKEIRYSNGNEVYLGLQRGVVSALRQLNGQVETEAITGGPQKNSESSPVMYARAGDDGREDRVAEPATIGGAMQQRFTDTLAYMPPAARPAGVFPQGIARPRPGLTLPAGWRLLGYLHSTYFLMETLEGLEIIEQHIAHERVLYERLLAIQETPGRISAHCQRLVISSPLRLSPEQRAILHENLSAFQALGFDFDFQENAILCTQVPLQIAHKNHEIVVQEMVSSLALTGRAEMALEATKSLACQAAVKNGMLLAETEILQLLCDWEKTPRNDTCPHGRPIRIKFSKEKLFELFHPK